MRFVRNKTIFSRVTRPSREKTRRVSREEACLERNEMRLERNARRAWTCNPEVPGSNPPNFYWMDLCLVVLNSTPLRFVNSDWLASCQLGFLSYFTTFVCLFTVSTIGTTVLNTLMLIAGFNNMRTPTDDWVFQCRQSKLWQPPTNLETQKQTKLIEIYQSQLTDVTF